MWHNTEVAKTVLLLKSDKHLGLSLNEVARRLDKFGKNQLPKTKLRSPFKIFLAQFLNPLIYLLLVAACIAYFVGEGKDSVVILLVVFLNAIIGTLQEGRAEQSLKSLINLSKLQSRVIRDGKEQLVEASEIVPGDIIILAAGDAVPADSRIIDATQLTAAEAALTGESLPIEKNSHLIAEDALLADRKNMLYAGTYVHSGVCTAIVTATGLNNEIGQIAKLTTTTIQPKTKLEIKIHQFGRYLIFFSVIMSALVILIGIGRGIALSQILMVALGQMVSLVPEGLPVAMTIAMAVGAQRMVKRGAIVRRPSAVETLGSTTVICTDKTGTLTRNEMTVTNIYLAQGQRNISIKGVGYNPSGSFIEHDHKLNPLADKVIYQLMRACILCNNAQLTANASSTYTIIGDPTEGALLALALKAGLDLQQTRNDCARIAEIPFDSNFKMMATQNIIEGKKIISLKGAPEVVLEYCRFFATTSGEEILSQEVKQQIQTTLTQMANLALRVLAIAYIKDEQIDSFADFKQLPQEAVFMGLIGQIDPPRDEVADAIKNAQQAGIKVVMVTGDHKSTAIAIAKSLGIWHEQMATAIDGYELEHLSNSELDKRIDRVNVFARVHPTHKLRIVEAFQRNKHVVAMTGDGVNDAPALARADVGVAMAITGTEVAKEASKIVITDDNFSTIVSAVAEGRLVYQNIKKLILFLFVTSIDEVAVLFLSLLFGYPIPFAAVQILWINLVTEGVLTINLIMDPSDQTEMKRPPVAANEPLLDKSMLMRMPLMVISSVTSTFGWFIFRYSQDIPREIIQSETFTVLAVCQWFNVLNCRSSWRSAFSSDIFKNPWLIAGLILGNILHIAVIYWKPLSQFFHTVPIAPIQFFAIGIVASFVLLTEELRKYFFRKKFFNKK